MRAAARRAIPRSARCGARRFRATTAAIPSFAPNGGTSPGGCATRDGRDFGVQVTFFRIRPGVAEDNPSALRADAAAVRPCRDRRSALRPAAARPARRTRGLRPRARGGRRRPTSDRRLVAAASPATRYRATVAGARLRARSGVRRRRSRSLLQGEPASAARARGPRRQATTTAGRSSRRAARSPSGERRRGDRDARGSITNGRANTSRRTPGWDWTGINLDDGGALMAFRIRGRRRPHVLGRRHAARRATAASRTFAPDDVRFTPQRRWRSPRTGVDISGRDARVAPAASTFALEPLFDDQELDSRRARHGLLGGRGARPRRRPHQSGGGYLELTGYGGALKI